MRVLTVILLALPLLVAADPLDYPAYPRAEAVSRTADESARSHDFVLSPVEKIRRELKIENLVHVVARRRSVTYLLPRGANLDDAIEHFEAIVSSNDVRFRCRGRDCGRSNEWANQIFGEPLLYGPDARQFYLAGEVGEELVSVYIVQRGNRRVYVHLSVLTPEGVVAIPANERLVQALTGTGHVVVRGVAPDRNGNVVEVDRQRLVDIGRALDHVRDNVIYVVCHLYAPGNVERLLERAQGCADAATAALGEASAAQFVGFAAGPMLPRAAENHSRIELVMPHRQNRD